MSYIFIIHKPDRSGFVLAADTRETLHGDVPHVAHTDHGEKLFFSAKCKFAVAYCNATTVCHADDPANDKLRLFIPCILKGYFEHLEKKSAATDVFVNHVKRFWAYLSGFYPKYVADIKKEVCFIFAGFDHEGKSCTARYGLHYDELEKDKVEGQQGITRMVPNMIYAEQVAFPEYVIDDLYLNKVCTKPDTAKALTRKTRLEIYLKYAFDKGDAINVARHVGAQAHSNSVFNPSGTIGNFFDCVEICTTRVTPSLVEGDRHGCKTMEEFVALCQKKLAEQEQENDPEEFDHSALAYVLGGSSPS